MSDTRDSLLLWLVHEHGFALEVPFGGRSGTRKWRWDAALGRVALEYQGIGAGHSWHKEQAKDHEKYNEGVLCGWIIILANAQNVNDGSVFEWIDAAVALPYNAVGSPVLAGGGEKVQSTVDAGSVDPGAK